ncbi:hypothetical protein ACO22_02130 [Paracoccidioides brasiliensis]|uniref:Uncharacterized protein n=1 Tax=Paracoccidioides brasiliensis TaxID=121759 RepID=A0A1D2JJM0_PARBR|nr:hypothetical protein ACO22_02130 [Paracoccidioides brasiliensis]ODH50561.1 hypothetical protein GX48_03243 [Paracoccidioides brasiliensis]
MSGQQHLVPAQAERILREKEALCWLAMTTRNLKPTRDRSVSRSLMVTLGGLLPTFNCFRSQDQWGQLREHAASGVYRQAVVGTPDWRLAELLVALTG